MCCFMEHMSAAGPYLLSVGLCLWAHFAAAHETWLAPNVYRAELGAPILLNIRNGEPFSGPPLPWLDWWIERFIAVEGPVERPLTGRLGNVPASRIMPFDQGLMVVGLQSAVERHPWRDWQAFKAFVTSKGLPGVIDAHAARGLPRAGFVEIYQRYLKTLIGIGRKSGHDRALGFGLEFVALSNPYHHDYSGLMDVRLIEDGAPLPKAPVTIFQRDATGRVVETRVLTDQDGSVHFSTELGSQYLLDAVTMRPAAAGTAAAWYTRWASMTFEN